MRTENRDYLGGYPKGKNALTLGHPAARLFPHFGRQLAEVPDR